MNGESYRHNNSGIDGAIFPKGLLGKYVETDRGNNGKVVEEWLCYPEPSEWKLEDGTVITEDSSERFTFIEGE